MHCLLSAVSEPHRLLACLLVFTWSLMGKLNFRRYLFLRVYPTLEIR